MSRLKWSLSENKTGFLVFIIILVAFSAITSIRIYEYQQELLRNPETSFTWAISGDEPMFLALTSNIIYHQSVFLEDHFSAQFSGINKDPLMTWGEQYKDNPSTWHAHQTEDGHYVSNQGPGLSYILVPSYAVFGIYGAMFTMVFFSSLNSLYIYKITFFEKNIGSNGGKSTYETKF